MGTTLGNMDKQLKLDFTGAMVFYDNKLKKIEGDSMGKGLVELKNELERYKGKAIHTIWGQCVVEDVQEDGGKLNIFLVEHGEPFFVTIQSRAEWEDIKNG